MRRARPLVLLTALLVAGALAAPAPAALATGPAATRALIGATGLVPQPGTEPVFIGDAPSPVVIGRIVLASAYRGVPGLGVVVETNTFYAPGIRPWVRVGRAITDAKGYVRIRMPKPRANTAFRVRFGGTTQYRPSTSATKYFTVRPVIAVTQSPAEIIAGVPFTVSGTVQPAGVVGLRAHLETACHDGVRWAWPSESVPVAPDGTFAVPHTIPAGVPDLLGTTALRIFVFSGDGIVDNAYSAPTPTAVVQTAGDPHLPGAPDDCVTIRF